MLNSLQMGFRTLAIEKRSSEVWTLLGAVKTEFGKFADVLAKTRERLAQASKDIGAAETRTRQIERKLRGVEALPQSDAEGLLPGDLLSAAGEGETTAPAAEWDESYLQQGENR
jgi:DNA recombination protein RmuC